MHTNMFVIEPEFVSLLTIFLLYMYSFFDIENHLEQISGLWKIFIFSICCIILNLLRLYSISNSHLIPLWSHHVLQVLYFTLIPLPLLFVFKYIVSSIFMQAGIIFSEQKAFFPFIVPTVLYWMLVFSNSFTHLCYSFDSELHFSMGYLYHIQFFLYFIYVLIFFLHFIKLRQHIDYLFTHLIIIGCSGLLGIIVLQVIFPYTVFTGTGLSLALLVVFISLQQSQINIDSLTGLLDRRTFFKMMESALKRQHSFRITFIEFYGLKRLNLRYGQDVGDLLLKQIAYFLTKRLNIPLVFRIRNTDFAIICNNMSQSDYDDLIEQILAKLNAVWHVSGNDFFINSGIAGILYSDFTDTEDEIVSNIEYALTLLKKHKKPVDENSVYIHFDQAKIQVFKRRDHLVDLMNLALQEVTFRICYQPIFSVKEKAYIGAEALLRMNDENGNPISPGEFIPVAEETGQVIRIGWLVFEKVCEFIRENSYSPNSFITINISAQHFIENDFVEKVVSSIERHGILPSQIKLEITERVLLQNVEYAEIVVQRLAKHGIGVFLDDFGTGYSNLFLVSKLPFECVKFDGSLITDITAQKTGHNILQSLISGVNKTGMKVLVEGIETQIQHEVMIEFGTDYLQGFFLNKPLEESVFKKNNPILYANTRN